MIRIVEVGPRDGLQNEKNLIPLGKKIEFIQKLKESGLNEIEVGSFVREDKIPQMKDSEEIAKIFKDEIYLVPNLKGYHRAKNHRLKKLAIFTAVSDEFNLKNMGTTFLEQKDSLSDLIHEMKKDGVWIRGYVSTVFGCPYQGRVDQNQVFQCVESLFEMGVDEVSIGDTIGAATRSEVKALILPLLKISKNIAVHFHDTRGQALVNTFTSFDLGIHAADSSAGGLGGCPFAKGATGNLSTEDLVFALQKEGECKNIDLQKLVDAPKVIEPFLQKPLDSRFYQATVRAKSNQTFAFGVQ